MSLFARRANGAHWSSNGFLSRDPSWCNSSSPTYTPHSYESIQTSTIAQNSDTLSTHRHGRTCSQWETFAHGHRNAFLRTESNLKCQLLWPTLWNESFQISKSWPWALSFIYTYRSTNSCSRQPSTDKCSPTDQWPTTQIWTWTLYFTRSKVWRLAWAPLYSLGTRCSNTI